MSDLSIRERVRASVIQEVLRVELLPLYIKRNQVGWFRLLT